MERWRSAVRASEEVRGTRTSCQVRWQTEGASEATDEASKSVVVAADPPRGAAQPVEDSVEPTRGGARADAEDGGSPSQTT